jgi:hypothetical protein
MAHICVGVTLKSGNTEADRQTDNANVGEMALQYNDIGKRELESNALGRATDRNGILKWQHAHR